MIGLTSLCMLLLLLAASPVRTMSIAGIAHGNGERQSYIPLRTTKTLTPNNYGPTKGNGIQWKLRLRYITCIEEPMCCPAKSK